MGIFGTFFPKNQHILTLFSHFNNNSILKQITEKPNKLIDFN